MKTALLILLHSSEKKARSRNPGEVLLVVLANNSCDVLKKLRFFHCSREIRERNYLHVVFDTKDLHVQEG